MANKPTRAGAVRRGRKGPQVGSGGQGRQALEGRGPTPKAEDRPYHPAGKRKAAQERYAAAGGANAGGGTGATGRKPARNGSAARPATRRSTPDDAEIVTGRNSVLEALRAKIPATALYVAARIDLDDRVREALTLANRRGIPLLEVMRPEIDRLAGKDSVHQGLALKVPPYAYANPLELLDRVEATGQVPLLVALDGVTDPRNLGAAIRSVGAFGGHGVIVPQRRSVGVTAGAWKSSAGAAARVPVAMAANLTATLKSLQERGLFVVGLDGAGATSLPDLDLATSPLVLVIGSEGKGLSRLVTETCDLVVAIPISATTESLNAAIAASVALYEIARRRASV